VKVLWQEHDPITQLSHLKVAADRRDRVVRSRPLPQPPRPHEYPALVAIH